MTRLLVLLIVGACTSASPRTELIDEARQASAQIDQGSSMTFRTEITQLIARADQLRVDQPGNAETTTEFLATALDASIHVDDGDVVTYTTPILELLDTATTLAK